MRPPITPLGPILGQDEFALFQTLVHKEAGILLPPIKRNLVAARLSRRIRELGLSSYRDYYRKIAGGDEAERVRLLDSLCTNETHFFREPAHFELLGRLAAEWAERPSIGAAAPRLRVWSAGCSTGEEPYSLAMTLRKHLAMAHGWQIEILATDLSTRALDQGAAGVFSIAKVGEIPDEYLKPFMLKGTGSQEGRMKVSAPIRAMVQFRRVNLNDDQYPVTGPFDVIFCRNVLIYFDAATKVAVLRRLLRHLGPRGYLFLGHAESVLRMGELVRGVGPTVYVHHPSRRVP